MIKTKILYLSLAVIFLPGCVYVTHFDQAMFLKGLDNNQKEMQAELNREQELYNNLKADIDNGRLHKSMQKRKIFRLYGEPTICKPAEGQSSIKETCVYRNPAGGLLAQIILLNLDAQGRLSSWEIQKWEK